MSGKEMNTKKKLLEDIDWNCAVPALVIMTLLAIPAIVFEEETGAIVNNFFNSFVGATSALYVLIPVVLVGIGLWMAFSRYGKVVLGSPKERPAVSNFTYIATLMAITLAAFASKADISKSAPSRSARLFWAILMSVSAPGAGSAGMDGSMAGAPAT